METESVYSLISSATHASAVTVTTDQLGLTVNMKFSFDSVNIFFIRVIHNFYFWTWESQMIIKSGTLEKQLLITTLY
jgi:hypothetical protein